MVSLGKGACASDGGSLQMPAVETRWLEGRVQPGRPFDRGTTQAADRADQATTDELRGTQLLGTLVKLSDL